MAGSRVDRAGALGTEPGLSGAQGPRANPVQARALTWPREWTQRGAQATFGPINRGSVPRVREGVSCSF